MFGLLAIAGLSLWETITYMAAAAGAVKVTLEAVEIARRLREAKAKSGAECK
jgi:hypothetical protein